jgi:PAS domain S-box-containing protein
MLEDANNSKTNKDQDIEKQDLKNQQWLLEKYRLLAENSVDCIWTLDKELHFTYASPSLEKILGYKQEEWIGTTLESHLTEEEYRKATKIIDEALEEFKNHNQPTITFETKAFNKQNKKLALEITGKVLVAEDGRLIGFQGATRDISKRKKAEELLEKSEKKYKTLVEQTPQALFLHDMDGNIVEINKKTINNYGYSKEELLSMKAGDIDPDYKDREDKGMFWNAINNNIIYFEARHKRKDGTIFPVYISLAVIELGKQKYIIALAEDITERKQTHQALRESEAKYRAIFENMVSASCLDEVIYDDGEIVDYRILDVNPAYEKLHGISRERAVGSLASQLYGTGKAPYLDIYSQVVKTGKPASFETYFELIKKYLYITVSTPKTGLISVIATDINKLKEVQQELRKLKDNLQIQVDKKTKELQERITELEKLQEATINREFRIKELRDEIKRLKREK